MRAPQPGREPKPTPERPLAEPVERLSAPEAPEAPEPLPLPRNPFRLALLFASIAANAGAGLLLWHHLTEEPYYGTQTGTLFITQLLDGLMLPLLTGGIIGVCLWLALGAVRGRDDA
jgi:hypothetical protein